MRILVQGHRSQNRQFRRLVRHCLRYSSRFLMEKRTRDKITVDVVMVKNLYHKEHAFGDCIFEDSSYRPREFTIRIDPCRSIKSIASTLAHELTHVSQFTTGQYKIFDNCDNIQRWKTKIIDTNQTDYDDLPWERHAYKMEAKIFKEYQKTRYWKKHHKKFPALRKVSVD